MFLASGPFFVAVYDERKSDEPVHRKSPKTTIDKSKRRGYDCVTRLRTFLKFSGPFFVAVYDERKSDEPVHRKSPKTTIDKSKRRGYDCVTRLRTFLKFTGISSQDPKRVLQKKKGGAQRLWARCTICCMIKIKMRQMKK